MKSKTDTRVRYQRYPADKIGRTVAGSPERNTKAGKGTQMQYTYIVECRDGTLYTGWTTDLEKRIKAHNTGKGAKYTKNRAPVRLVYHEEYETKQEALKREYAIKQMTRREKLALIAGQAAEDPAGDPTVKG